MTATLTNCYVPLPAATTSSSSCHLFDPLARIDDNDGDTSSLLVRKTNHNDKSSSATATTTAGTNKTTRGPRTLRRLRLETSILSSSNSGGSSLVEWGHTKLLVSVRGPRPITASSMMKPHDGGGSNSNGVNLVCEVRYMPHVGINIETIALHTLSHDFTTSSSTSSSSGNKDGSGSRGGGSGVRRVPRDTISTAQDTALLSSGGSPCAPAAFTDETIITSII